MLTIFACPKSFNNKNTIIQTNSLNSWKNLSLRKQIIYVGNDKTVEVFSKKSKIDFIKNVRVNKYGTPYVNSIFELAEERARFDTMVYVNADILLFDDFVETIKTVDKKLRRYLIVGQRYDCDVGQLIDFTDRNQVDIYYNSMRKEAKRHGIAAVDYFVYKKGSLGKIPAFLIGRDSWDNWMIYNARQKGFSVLDATKSVTALHQNHDYSHLNKTKKIKEDFNNDSLALGKTATLLDATHKIDQNLNLRKISPIKRSIANHYHDLMFLLLHLYKKH